MKPGIRILVQVYIKSAKLNVTGQGDFMLDRMPTDEDLERMSLMATRSMNEVTGVDDFRVMENQEVEAFLDEREKEQIAKGAIELDGEVLSKRVTDVN